MKYFCDEELVGEGIVGGGDSAVKLHPMLRRWCLRNLLVNSLAIYVIQNISVCG